MTIGRILGLVILFAMTLVAANFAYAAGETRYSGGQYQFYNGSSWLNMVKINTGAACSPAGAVRYNASRIEFCDGATWNSTDGAQNLGSCTAAGTTRYASSIMQFCNGSQWRPMYLALVNGACGSAASGACTTAQPTSNQCSAGTFSDTSDTGTLWRWSCNGSGGGTNASCDRDRCQNCGATTISNCSLPARNHGQSVAGTCAGTGSCNYTCNNGSWTQNSNSCAAATLDCGTTMSIGWSCTGSTTGTGNTVGGYDQAACIAICESAGSAATLCCEGREIAAGVLLCEPYSGSRSYIGGTLERATNCSFVGPVNGVCTNNGASNNLCSAGTPNDGAVADTASQWRWRCDGQNGGSNSGTCFKDKPVNGVCGSAETGACTTAQPTSNQCSAGTYADTSDTGTLWRWSCNGANGGSNDSCSRARCQNCGATTISNCSLPARNHGQSVAGTCAGTGSCNYTCNNGTFTQNSNSCTAGGVNGACGTAHGSTTLPGMPSGAAACSAGTQTNQITSPLGGGFVAYTWDCAGSGGGTTANCNGSGFGAPGSCPAPWGGNVMEGTCMTQGGWACDWCCCTGTPPAAATSHDCGMVHGSSSLLAPIHCP